MPLWRFLESPSALPAGSRRQSKRKNVCFRSFAGKKSLRYLPVSQQRNQICQGTWPGRGGPRPYSSPRGWTKVGTTFATPLGTTLLQTGQRTILSKTRLPVNTFLVFFSFARFLSNPRRRSLLLSTFPSFHPAHKKQIIPARIRMSTRM